MNKREYHLLPDFKLPDVEEAAFGDAEAAAAEASNDEGVAMKEAAVAASQWKWFGAESVYPYWAVSRWTIAELRKWQALPEMSTVRFNMEVVELNFMNMSVSCNSRAITQSVNVRILTNTVALREVEQLCVEAMPKAAST